MLKTLNSFECLDSVELSEDQGLRKRILGMGLNCGEEERKEDLSPRISAGREIPLGKRSSTEGVEYNA